MRRFKYAFLLWGGIITLALLATQSINVEAAAQKQGPHKTPPIPAASTAVANTLFGIAALSSDSIWAVGTSMNVPQFTGQPLIEHENGNNWQVVPGPATPQNELSTLIGITAVTNNDVWAVGFSMNTTKPTGQVLIEHWNGSNWQIVPGPTNVKSGGLSAITALGPDDIWAVGSADAASGTGSEALILHWNGSNWQTIPAASTTENSHLLSVTAVSANDIWAVGSSFSSKGSKALIEHWNGNTWNAVSTSDLPASFVPAAISAHNADDIWITGAQDLAHWNTKSWQSFPTTSQKGLGLFNAITILAHDNAWVVGSSLEIGTIVPLIEHWNGSRWQVISNSSPAFKKTTPTTHR